jgi:hypothetical protein
VDPVSFGVKVVPSLNGADPSFMNSVTGSVCRAKCSNILQDTRIETAVKIKYEPTMLTLQLLLSKFYRIGCWVVQVLFARLKVRALL